MVSARMLIILLEVFLHTVKKWPAITNPLVNSYKRLVPGYDAPTELTWTKNNQNSLIRISNLRSDRPGNRASKPRCICKSLPCVCCLYCSRSGWNSAETISLPTASDHSLSESDQKAMNIGTSSAERWMMPLTHFEE